MLQASCFSLDALIYIIVNLNEIFAANKQKKTFHDTTKLYPRAIFVFISVRSVYKNDYYRDARYISVPLCVRERNDRDD